MSEDDAKKAGYREAKTETASKTSSKLTEITSYCNRHSYDKSS
jgi:hypothetical protein